VIEQPVDEALLDDAEALAEAQAAGEGMTQTLQPDTATQVRVFNVQFDSPDVASVPSAEALVRSAPGVRAASTTSLALGGVSVMRVTFDGDADGLRAALASRGWRVSLSGDTLRIRR
jgi:hypothetical protein